MGGGALRLPRLAERPLHTDEAVQAVKTGGLLDGDGYRYDAYEYHGPTLHYLALPFLHLRGETEFARTRPETFRLVTVAVGLALVLAHAWLVPLVGARAALIAALLTALSPALTYYSRYYIHELLFTLCTFALLLALAYWYRRPSRAAALCAGAAAGLTVATKETWVFTATALAAAIAFSWLLETRQRDRAQALRETLPRLVPALGMVFVAFVVVWLVLFSSLFQNWRGLADSILTFVHYGRRGAGDSPHVHPWWFYLRILCGWREMRGPLWHELGIAVPGLLGAVVAIVGDLRGLPAGLRTAPARATLRTLAVYALLLTLLYSAIPYKTPWCILTFLHAWVLLAGLGCCWAWSLSRSRIYRVVLALAIVLGLLSLLNLNRAANGRFACDQRNPYVYAHTVRDLPRLAERVLELSRLHPDGDDMLVRVVTDDYWPLPFYWRSLNRVGYWHDPADAADAPVVVTQPDLAEEVEAGLEDDYQVEYRGLRPQVHLLLYVERGLWERFLKSREAPGP
jgi:uncharacterized protein (TIGR03663 family)